MEKETQHEDTKKALDIQEQIEGPILVWSLYRINLKAVSHLTFK